MAVRLPGLPGKNIRLFIAVEQLRDIIREVITEVLKDTSGMNVGEEESYSDIDGWSAHRYKEDVIHILDKSGITKGFVTQNYPNYLAGVRVYYSYSKNSDKWSNVKWHDFADIKNAVRYVYLKSQMPKSNVIKEVGYSYDNWPQFIKQIDIPGIEGWIAKRYEEGGEGKEFDYWSIHSRRKDPNSEDFIHQGKIYDNGLLTIDNMLDQKARKENNRQDLSRKPIQAARYIWLRIQDQNADV